MGIQIIVDLIDMKFRLSLTEKTASTLKQLCFES